MPQRQARKTYMPPEPQPQRVEMDPETSRLWKHERQTKAFLAPVLEVVAGEANKLRDEVERLRAEVEALRSEKAMAKSDNITRLRGSA
jgi:hypothetical protein